MKQLFKCVGTLLLIGLTLSAYSIEQSTLAQKATSYLAQRGEVRLKVAIKSNFDVVTLSRIVDVDQVHGNEVSVYANENQFKKFCAYDFNYSVPAEWNDPPQGVITGGYAKEIENNLPYEWDKYPTYNEYVTMMNKFASDYPNLCKIEEFGQSIRGKKYLAVKISDKIGENEAEPRFFYQSTVHGDELCGYVLTLRLIDYLLSKYNSDKRVKRLVDSMEIWINPLGNPDGTYNGSNTSTRNSRRQNSNGVDLNRSFKCPTGRPQASSQKETKIIQNFAKGKKFSLEADFHSGAELVCYIWGCWSQNVADKAWWEYVGKEWASNAQRNSPSGYFTQENGCVNAYRWYVVRGERMNGATYFEKSRDLTIEVSYTKKLPSSQLNAHWGYQKEAMLSYMEQALNGVRGTVTDSTTGDPILAKVFISGHDKDSSHIYSFLPHGDYYRYLYRGNYNITFTALNPNTMKPDTNYDAKTIRNVNVVNDRATILNVKLKNKHAVSIANTADNHGIKMLKMIPRKNGVSLSWANIKGAATINIYSMKGTLVKTFNIKKSNKGSLFWNGTDHFGQKVGAGSFIVNLNNNAVKATERLVITH